MNTQQEELILAAARTNDPVMDELLFAAAETMPEAQFMRVCDKVTQIFAESLHDLRGWKDVEVAS